jgi:purine-nucleoside phosphorylase
MFNAQCKMLIEHFALNILHFACLLPCITLHPKSTRQLRSCAEHGTLRHVRASSSAPAWALWATLIVSNAAGGLNPNFDAGDVMVIDDHVNLLSRNPLVGINDDRLGPRFPDMSAPYDRRLGDRALAIAREHDFVCHRGVYIAMLGPTYETRAEIRMLRHVGGDAVGMSTVPEVIVAVHAGLRVLGLSTITNVCSPDIRHTTSGEQVVATAETARDKLQAIVADIVESEFGAGQNH